MLAVDAIQRCTSASDAELPFAECVARLVMQVAPCLRCGEEYATRDCTMQRYYYVVARRPTVSVTTLLEPLGTPTRASRLKMPDSISKLATTAVAAQEVSAQPNTMQCRTCTEL